MGLRIAYFHCSLCSYEFEKNDESCHTGCALAKYCKLVRCPNCGYEFPEPSVMPIWLQKLMGKPTAIPPRDLMRLDEGNEGTVYELVQLSGPHASRRTALAVYGLVPGCQLSLTQKRPSFIVRVGETELAFEGNIAREMFVKPVPA